MDELEELFAGLSAAEAPPVGLTRRTRAAMMNAAGHRHADCRAQRGRRRAGLAILPDAILCGPCPVRVLALTIHRAPTVKGCPFVQELVR